MASSSSAPESNMQESVQGTSTQETPAYEIKGRTMTLEEWDLNELFRHVEWISHLCHIVDATLKSTMRLRIS